MTKKGAVASPAAPQILKPTSANQIYRGRLPKAEWWQVVSKSAKSGDPYWSAMSELAALMAADPELEPWPEALWQTQDSLPAVSGEEALAILERFARVEFGAVEAGVAIYPFHWDLLAAHYCPMRERYSVLRQMARSGLLQEAAGTALHQESDLRWPLAITADGVARIRRARLSAGLPVFRRVEDFLSDVTNSFPSITKALTWFILGGGFVKLLDWLT